jgi:hypothetical protein
VATRLVRICVVVCLALSQMGCAWFGKPRTGAYEDGYRKGCDARERGSGYEARDADARAQLQRRYWEGWSHGFNGCLSPWEKQQQEKFLHGEEKKYCSKHQKKRGNCPK